MKQKLLLVGFCCAVLAAVPSPAAINFGPFGPHGEGGTKNAQTFTIGAGGTVFELDAFLNVAGVDLNGTNSSQPGTSAQLSQNSLPPGLVFTFATNLSPDRTSLLLTYTFTNTTDSTISNVSFFVMLDAEIDQATNTFFNEYGTLQGAAGHGAADGSPDQWQIDQPGFPPLPVTLFGNLLAGHLNNSNAVPQNAPDDVALSLGFTLGDIAPGGSPALQVMISENGNSLGSLALVQHDSDAKSKTFITLSGGVAPALSGGVFVDSNTNSFLDAGEGVANVPLVLLTNGVTVITNTVTDANGRYSFNAVPGLYSVRLDTAVLPPGVAPVLVVAGAASNPSVVTLIGGVSQTLNWGYHARAALSGRVFVDANTNNVFDAGEQPLANVTVVLLLPSGTTLAQTTTGTNGVYNFGSANPYNLDPNPGPYLVRVDTNTLPTGLTVLLPAGTAVPTNTAPVTVRATGPTSQDFVVLVSGQAARAEFHFTSWTNNWVTGSLLGTLRIANTNAAGSGTVLEPLQLGLRTSPNFFWATNELGKLAAQYGTSPNLYATTPDLPNIDLTEIVHLLNGGSLNPGQSVVVTNIPVFSRGRALPTLLIPPYQNTNFVWVPTNSVPQP